MAMTLDEYKEYMKKNKKKIVESKIQSGKALTLEEYREYVGFKPTKEESKTDKWFKAGAFEDGYQFGDLTKTMVSSGADLTLNAGKGILGLVEGVTDLVGYGAMGVTSLFDKDKAQEMKQRTQESWVDNLLGGLEEKVDKNSIWGDKADNIAQGIGYVGGIVATGGIGGAMGLGTAGVTALTTGTTFLSSMGGGMGEAYNEGASDIDAVTFGAIKGIADAGTELIFGGLGKAVGAVGLSSGISSLDDVFAQKLSSKVTNQVAKNFIEFGVKAGAEGSEEVMAGVLSAIGKKVTYMEDEELAKLVEDEKLLDQFIAGAITSGFAQSGFIPGMKNGSLREANKTGRDFISGYTQNEQSVLDQVSQEEIQRQEQESGKSLTNKEKNAIKKDIETMLKRGEIDTDTIEKTFGGESYTAYDNLRKESDEYKTLADTPLEKLSLNEQKRRDELDAKNTEKSYSDRLLEAQGKLSETVNKATENDMYLRESFAEKGRKGEVFKLSEEEKKSFTAEEMKIVNKAIESGDINNTRKAHDMVSFVAKLSAQTKTDFDFTNNKKLAEAGYIVEGKTIDGFKQGNKIAVNLQSKKALNTVVGHEITHVLEGTDLYTALQSTLKEYATTKGVYNSLFNTAKENYKNVYKGLTEAEYNKKIEQEVTADLVGEYIFSDMDFVRNLSTKNPNVFQKVFNEIKYMLKVATAGSDAEKQLLKAKKIFEDVYRDTKRNTSEETQYSMSFEGMVTRKYYDTKQNKFLVNDYDNYYDIEILDDGGYNVIDTIPISGNEELIKDLQRERRNYANSKTNSTSTSVDRIRSNGEFNDRDNTETQRERTWTEYADSILAKYTPEELDRIIHSRKSEGNSQGNNQIAPPIKTSQSGVFFDDKTQFSVSEDYDFSVTDDELLDSMTDEEINALIEDIVKLPAKWGYELETETPIAPRYKGDTETLGKIAKLTDDRIERLFREYGASNPNYAKAYISSIHPRDFLSLTLSDKSLQLWDEASQKGTDKELQPLDIDKLRNEIQTPFLEIDTETGRVTGHEGRHRMRALLEAGITNVPIAVIDVNTKYSKQKESSIRLKSQEYSNGYVNNNFNTEIKNLIPINKVNSEDIYASYGGKGDINFSLSDPNQDIAPMPKGIYGKDVMLDIAPTVENTSQTHDKGTKTHEIAPDVTGMTTRMRQEEIEMQNEMFPPMTEEDAHNMLDSDEDWDRLRKMQEAVEPQEDIDDTIYPMSDTARLSEADLREVRKSIKDKLPLQRGRTKEFNDIVQRYSTSEYPNLDALFYEIKDNFGTINVTEEIEDVAEVQNILKQTRINVSDNIKKGVTDYVQTMRRNSFKMRFSKDGLPVDVAYQELSEMYPNMFPEDITNEVDQFEQLVSVANMMRKETGEFEIDDYTIGETVNSIVNTVRDIRTRHNQNTAERRARWFDKDTTLEEYMQTDDFAELEGNPNLLRVFQERWDRNRLTTEPQIDETTAQILDSEPQVHKKGFKENLKRKWAVFKANFVDKGAVFEDLSKVTKNRQLEAKWDYTMLSDAQAQNFMQNGDEGSKSLESIREEVDNTGFSKEFSEYMYHYLNIDRMTLDARYGIENKTVFGQTVTADVSKQKISELESAHPEFKAFAKDVYTYMNELRGRLVKNGVISQETADLWSEMYPHYVPIRRVDSKGLDVNVPLATNRTGVNAPIKKATGGNSDILPLFDTMAQRTMQTFKAINKNDFGIELKNTLGSTIGVENSSVDGAIDMVESQDALLKAGENGYNPTFTVFEDGKRVTFEITQEMYEALLPMSERLRDSGSKILQTASSIHRGVLTQYNPVFALTNGIKDMQDILINSQHPMKTYAKIVEATQQLMNKGQWYQEYMKQGGGDNSYFDTDTNTIAPVRKGISKVLDTFPLKKINDLNEFIERVPRLAEYIASREMGRSVQESMLDASRVTTNFKAGGDVTKFLNKNGATFLNASVQGVAQQVRNVREAKMNGLKGWGMLATKFAVAGLPALLLNHLLWDDDEEYEELSDYVKQNYYVIGKTEDGHFIRIPKGRTLAVIQEAVNQVDKLATGDDSADLKTFLEVLANNLAPNNPISNNVLAPIIQASTNKTWYGEDLVPQNLQDLPGAEQYDESTDSISKAIGNTFNISPMKVNYLLDQYTGLVGDMILPALTPEVTSGTEGALGFAIAPLKDKFMTDGVMNKQVITDFYNKSDELTSNAKKSTATSEDILRNKYLNSIKAEMNDLYKQKREIQNSDLTNKEKYAQVREIQSQISALAQEGMSNYENAEVYDYYGKVNDRHFRLNDEGEWQKINEKQLAKQNEVTSALGISANDYWSSKEEYDYMYEQPGKYGIAKAIGGYDTYKTLTKSLNEIKADQDQYGRTINNSRKFKVVSYLNNLDADYYTKIMLYKAEYTSDDRYNVEIINYLNEREDISYQEMADILTELGFKVTADGRISW